jgi:hypothetical protein
MKTDNESTNHSTSLLSLFQKDCSRVTVAATKSGMMSRETAPGNGTGTRHILGQKQRLANQKPFEEKIYKFCTIRSHSRMFGKPF